ncbi:MAG: glycosyltransferase family 2 protein [Patescibacteria group bacterium]|nr:glycosyltransferase family 2 protein [Patescibacteria group bacterium]
MDISIIILNYKSKVKTLICLESVLVSDLEGIKTEIIVVDNNSNDGIEAVIQDRFDFVKFIQNDKNIGMGAGNNLGVKISSGKFILILNADTRVENSTIKELYRLVKSWPAVGMLAPELVYPDKKHQDSCFRFPSFLMPLYRRTFIGRFFKSKVNAFLVQDQSERLPLEVDWVMGSCLLIRREAIDKIGGGFDERYFMYFEDVDMARSLWQAGYKVIYYPKARVIHDHGRGSKKQAWFIAPFTNRLAREHIKSWLKYFYKWRKI